MKKLNKILCTVLALTMVLALCACGGTTETQAPQTEAPASEAPATEAPATEAPETEAPAGEFTTVEEGKLHMSHQRPVPPL